MGKKRHPKIVLRRYSHPDLGTRPYTCWTMDCKVCGYSLTTFTWVQSLDHAAAHIRYHQKAKETR